jgi:hypothetical protein
MDPRFHDLGTSLEWSASRPDRFTSGERAPGTHWIECWVALILSGRLGDEKILAPSGKRTPTPRSSSSQPVAIRTTLVMFIALLRIVRNIWA